MNAANMMPITEGELLLFGGKAEADLAMSEWSPKKSTAGATSASAGDLLGSFGSLGGGGSTPSGIEKVSILGVAKKHADGALLMSDTVHHVLATIKRALQIGYHTEQLYVKAVGLDDLELQNTAKKLPQGQLPEFNAKQMTRAGLALHVTASYVVWQLGGFRADEASSLPIAKPAITELPLTNAIQARRSMIYYLGKALESSEVSGNDLAFLRVAVLYFRAILDELVIRKDNLQYAEAFTGKKYKLEKEEFVIDGWSELADRSVVSVEFRRLEFKDIVGNRVAKHASLRAVGRLLCYDPGRKMNPMLELGGLAPIRLGHGQPGTGKSMLIAAIATKLQDLAKEVGIPFLFHPLPDGLISTYQGGSAERMDTWMRVLADPTKLIYAPIDDAENIFKNRAHQGVSEGERGVQSVFLRRTEGAYAIPRGNTLIDFFTNLPEQIDPATMSRIVERYVIDGARTEEDVMDQDMLWAKKYMSVDPEFDNTRNPGDYKFFAAQEVLASLSHGKERYAEPKVPRVRDAYEKAQRRGGTKDKRFFGAFTIELQKTFPTFTSRDLRNIQSAVSSRILDFDFPAEWFDKPELFFLRSYDEKKGMLVELMKQNMKGLSFAEVRLEEFLRYADGVAEMADVEFERDVSRGVYNARVHAEVLQRISPTQQEK